MSFYTRFKPPKSPSIEFSDPSLTQQCFKKECDVNTILAKFRETGSLVDPLHPPTRLPMFGDFSDLPDYQGMLDMIQAADDAFMTLPAAVRKKFDNDPQKVIDFLQNSDNYEEAVKLGLCNPRPVDQPVDKPDDKPAD